MPKWSKVFAVPKASAQEIFNRASNEVGTLLEKADIGHFELERDPVLCQMTFRSRLAEAELQCRDGELEVHASLGLAVYVFRGKIEQMLNDWIARWR